MKTNRKKRIMITAGLLGLVLLFTVSMASASTVFVDPNPVIVIPGGNVTASVFADFSDVSGGVSGGGFQLAWNPSILTLTARTVSTEIQSVIDAQAADINVSSPGFAIITIDNPSGTLNMSFDLCPLGAPCDFLSAFNTIDVGFDVSPTFTDDEFKLTANSIGDVWVQDSTPLTQPEYIGAAITVGAPVPIPGAVWLLGSGLLGMVGLKRRRKS